MLAFESDFLSGAIIVVPSHSQVSCNLQSIVCYCFMFFVYFLLSTLSVFAVCVSIFNERIGRQNENVFTLYNHKSEIFRNTKVKVEVRSLISVFLSFVIKNYHRIIYRKFTTWNSTKSIHMHSHLIRLERNWLCHWIWIWIFSELYACLTSLTDFPANSQYQIVGKTQTSRHQQQTQDIFGTGTFSGRFSFTSLFCYCYFHHYYCYCYCFFFDKGELKWLSRANVMECVRSSCDVYWPLLI